MEAILRIRGGRSLGSLAQTRDVAGGNETAVPGQMTTANDGMGGGLAAAD
jgi:hypothetical protein